MCIFFITFVGFLCAHRCSRTLVQRIIVCIIDPLTSPQTFDSPAFRSADVAIEFTRPEAAEQNIRAALAQGVPVVSGTTGWDVEGLKATLNTQPTPPSREGQGVGFPPGVIWSSNYSIGVNILFAVNKYLAQLLHNTGGYQPSITEVHHIHKIISTNSTHPPAQPRRWRKTSPRLSSQKRETIPVSTGSVWEMYPLRQYVKAKCPAYMRCDGRARRIYSPCATKPNHGRDSRSEQSWLPSGYAAKQAGTA